MSRNWLLVRLKAPLMSFGGEAVDHVGPTRDFPSASMITGLIANALGWRWGEKERHQELQDRLIFGAAISCEGEVLTDTQNAELAKKDKGWTTSGVSEGRAGDSYGGPHRRRRDYLMDAEVLVALRLEPAEVDPTIEVIASALDRPARPLFIGRKSCLPTGRLFAGVHQAETVCDALLAVTEPGSRAIWPEGEGPEGDRLSDISDLRNWLSGLHGGARRVIGGVLP